ncbi:MAG: TRAP transporter small permease [Deferribacteraceae bacterium]|jgi:TRAP-type C4-dicarboxylate transport system permease small subunit|nr:TRAP transporter small permease [Deferribacteraceae bacterium]
MKSIDKFLGAALVFLMALMTLGCLWQVVTRFILSNPSKYTEEFLRYALIWLTMLGAPYAYGQYKHIAFQFITAKFQPQNLLRNKIIIECIVLFLSISVFVVGGIMVTLNSSGQISPAMQMPMEFYYVGLPISGILTSLYCIKHLSAYFKEMKEA